MISKVIFVRNEYWVPIWKIYTHRPLHNKEEGIRFVKSSKNTEINSILAQHREESAQRIKELMKEMEEAVRGRQTL